MESVKLSQKTSVAQYRRMEAEQNRAGIVHFLRERFEERYLRPLNSVQRPHGFFTMAIACLLIEAIQAFRNGWQGTTEQRKKPYRRFFRDFGMFFCDSGISTTQADQLYDNIRSGILHLGETYGGWRIHRRGRLIDFENRTLNADLFIEAIRLCFEEYCEQLLRSPWHSDAWNKFRDRMRDLIRNCEVSDHDS
jgi:hypothetical protein